MDQDNQNQSVDGMRSSNNMPTSSGVDGFMAPPPKSTSFGDEQKTPENYNEISEPVNNLESPKKSNKTKIWLIVFIVLFILAAGAAVFMYMQYSSAKSDLDTAKKTNTQTTTLKQENDTLKQQNADLEKTVNSQTEYINSLLKVANQLKTTCGSKCASIAIPPAPSNVPTPTPSTAPTATPKASATPTPTPTP